MLGKYVDYQKNDVIGKVAEQLWYDWLEQASDEDRADDIFMKKVVVRRGECLKFASESLRSDVNVVIKAVKSSPAATLKTRSDTTRTLSAPSRRTSGSV